MEFIELSSKRTHRPHQSTHVYFLDLAADVSRVEGVTKDEKVVVKGFFRV